MESSYSIQPKFADGQRVRIITQRDIQGRLKHPEIQQYESKTGVIVDYFSSGVLPRVSEAFFFYNVRMDEDGAEVNVWEDSLEPLGD